MKLFFFPLLAAGFVNPLLLGGLGLAVVPILIHLLSRRRFRRIDWGATRFLLEAEKENRRRVRFEQWLLVALRCLAMALLALLVARPFVKPGLVSALLGGRTQVQRIIVIDDSASLGYRVGTGLEFDNLRTATTRLLSWLQQEAPNDPVTLLLTSKPDEPLVSGARLDLAALNDLRDRVDRLAPSNLPAHPRQILTAIAERLAAAGKLQRADLYVLSDFQRTNWLAGSAGGSAGDRLKTDAPVASQPAAAQSVFESLRKLDTSNLRVVLIASGIQSRENVAVPDVRLERPQTMAGLPAVALAQVTNFASHPIADLTLQAEIDGAALPPVPLETVEPGGRRQVSLEVTFPQEGYAEFTVGVEPSGAFPADDRYRMAVHIKPALAVLLVNGQPAADPYQDEVHLLRNALLPPGPFSSGMRVDVIDPSEIEATDLNIYDCVLLCNVAAPPEATVAVLRRYAQSGGGLAFFLGGEVGDPAEYNRIFYGEGDGLLPAPLEGLKQAPGRAGATAETSGEAANAPAQGVGLIRAADHPVTAMFPAGGDTLSEAVHFRAYYRCAEPEDAASATQPASPAPAGSQPAAKPRPPATVLARYADAQRTPAILERPFWRGRVLLFTSSVDLEWNDWARATDGSYVVTMLELVQYLARRDAQPAAFIAGEPLLVPISLDTYEPRAVFKSPAFPEEPAVEVTLNETAPAVGDLALLRGPVATRLGAYHVELSSKSGRFESRPLCVNLDPVESDLAVATPAELDSALTGIPHELIASAADFLRTEERTHRELWATVLLVVLTVLMMEQGLAWWFGKSERRPGGANVGVRR